MQVSLPKKIFKMELFVWYLIFILFMLTTENLVKRMKLLVRKDVIHGLKNIVSMVIQMNQMS